MERVKRECGAVLQTLGGRQPRMPAVRLSSKFDRHGVERQNKQGVWNESVS